MSAAHSVSSLTDIWHTVKGVFVFLHLSTFYLFTTCSLLLACIITRSARCGLLLPMLWRGLCVCDCVLVHEPQQRLNRSRLRLGS